MSLLLRVRFLFAAALCCAALLSACGGDVSRRDVLAELTDQVVIPRFEAAASWSAALDATAAALAAQPNAGNLEEAREAWRSAQGAWARTEAMWFGPVMDRRSESLISYWLNDPKEADNRYPQPIEARLARSEAINAEAVVEVFASTERGLHAVEYLLFAADERVLSALAEPGSRYADYLLSLTEVIAEETAALRDAWREEYGDQFAGRGERAIGESLALTELVRVSVFLTETVADMQLGDALGMRGGEPNPLAIPGGAAERALEDVRERVLGMQELYLGASDGLGVGDLIAALSEETDERMRAAFAAAVAAIDAIAPPLKSAAAEGATAVVEAREAIEHLQRVMNTEVVSLLGISVGFSDNDGDS